MTSYNYYDTMSIIYTVISRGTTILVDYTKCTGNFIVMAREVLKHCNPQKKYSQFQVQGYFFYSIYIDGVIYMCMCEHQYSQRLAFTYLEDIKKVFLSTFDESVIQKSSMYGSGLSAFSTILKDKCQLYNTPQKVDKVFELQKAVDQIMDISRDNLDKAILRGDKIEVLMEKTKTMSALSMDLRDSSKTLKTQMMWKNWKWKIIIGLVIALVIYFILVLACGGFTMSKCF